MFSVRNGIAMLLTILGSLLLPDIMPAQQGAVRAVHLSPDAPPVDMYVGDTTQRAVSNLPFGAASASLTRPTGVQRLITTPTGMPGTRLIDVDVQLDTGRRMNVLVVNTLAQIEAFAIAFNLNRQPVPDSISIRLVHASPDAGNVDIRLKDASGAVRTFSAFSFKGATQFFTIPAGTAEVWILVPGTGTVIRKFGGNLPGNTHASIIITGMMSDLKIRLLNELSTTLQNPMTELGPLAEAPASLLRVVHAVSDGPPVDLYLGDTLTASGLSFLDASPLVGIDSGYYTIGVTLEGQPLGNAVLNTTLDMNADTAYTIVAVGSLLGAQLDALTLKRRVDLAATDSTILLRFLHAGFAVEGVDVAITDSSGGVVTSMSALFRVPTDYIVVPAGSISMRITPSGSHMPLLMATGSFSGGTIATLIVTATGGIDVRAHALIDNDGNAQQPMYELDEIGRGGYRLVHVSPDAPSVDAFLYDDTAAVGRVGFRDASKGVDLYSEQVGLKIAGAGTGIGSAVIDTSIGVVANELRTIFALGTIADLTLGAVILEARESDMPSAGNVAIRLLQACPDSGPLDIGMTFGNNPTQGFNSVMFGSATDYMEVPAGAIRVRIYESGGADSILDVSGVIPPDALVTAIVTGRKSDGTLGVNLLIDINPDEQRPMILLSSITTSVDRDGVTAGDVTVAPNPARGSTTISYTLRRTGSVRIALYDMLGRLAAISEPGEQPPGHYAATFSTIGIAAGRYSAIVTDSNGTMLGRTGLVVW